VNTAAPAAVPRNPRRDILLGCTALLLISTGAFFEPARPSANIPRVHGAKQPQWAPGRPFRYRHRVCIHRAEPPRSVARPCLPASAGTLFATTFTVERDATSSFLSSLQRGFASRLQAFAPWVGTACSQARAQARLKTDVTQCCHNAHHRLNPVADRMPAEGRQRWVDEPHTKVSINTCEDLNP
jgi:hypothetical protein